jgi:hypothetical protein
MRAPARGAPRLKKNLVTTDVPAGGRIGAGVKRRGAGILVGVLALAVLGAACGTVDPPPAPTEQWPESTAKAPATTTTTKPPATTTTTKPVAPSEMPTRSNTGPSGITGTMTAEQFLASGVCDHKRITEQVRDDSGRMLGRTFRIEHCALDGGLYYVHYGSSSDSQFPMITIKNSSIDEWIMFSPMRATVDRAYITGAFWAPCPDCPAQDHQANQTSRAMPITVTNSLFWKGLPPATSPYHSEALHVVGGGVGYSFTNTRFVQEGPYNGTQTGAIKFTGRDSTFTDVVFDFGGTGAASYATVYLEGTNVRVNRCRVARGLSSYQFPTVWSDGNGYVVPPLTGCVDFHSGAPLA